MKYHSVPEQANESNGDDDIKIVKHSAELNVELPNLETTDSIDRHSSESNITQNTNITPTRYNNKAKEIVDFEYIDSLGKDIKDVDQCDNSNTFISHSSSLVNSVERTTAPSSMVNSISRYDNSYNSNLSPSTNFQTPCGRNPKRRNTSSSCFDECFQNKDNEKLTNLNLLGVKKKLVESAADSTEVSGISSNETQHSQINGPILLSAVLQVIASIQKFKNGEPNGVNRGKLLTSTANTNCTTAVVNNLTVNNNNNIANNNVNIAAQILGSKLPGVHPTTAALALAYSLSVAASTKRTSNAIVNSDDFIQNLNQIIFERISSNNYYSGNTDNTNNLKITNDLLQSIVSSLNSVVTHSQSEVTTNIQKKNTEYLISPNRLNEYNNNSKLFRFKEESKASGSSYNFNLPPMDFIMNEKLIHNDSRKVLNYQNVINNSYPNKSMLYDIVNNTNVNYHKLLSNLDAESSLEIGSEIEEPFNKIEYTNEGCQISESTFNSKSFVNDNIQTVAKSYQLMHENNNPLSLMSSEINRCSEKKIILESSNNYIWNDILYNQVFDHVDFDAPFSRKHAYLRNELLFYNKPVLEIDHGGDSFSAPNYIRIPNHYHYHSNHKSNTYSHNYNVKHPNLYNVSSKSHIVPPYKYQSSSNIDFYNLHKYNPRIQSFCDDLLVNSSNKKNSQIFNSINYLMQIVGDGNVNSNSKMNNNGNTN